MRAVAIVLAALVCASCGSGSSGTSPDPSMPSSSAAMPPVTATSAPASASSSSSSPSTPATPQNPSTPTTSTSSPPSRRITYKIVEIPRLTAAGAMTANAVNDQGIIVGDYSPYCVPNCSAPGQSFTPAQAWMYQRSSGALNQLIFDPSETGAGASGVSNSGIISGREFSPQNGIQPVIWTVTGGAMALSGPDCSCWAVAANDGGTVIGQFQGPGAPGSAAIMWTPPVYAQTILPGLECDYCPRVGISIYAINNGGTAVGSSLSSIVRNGQPTTGGSFAVEWQAGAVSSLGALQGSNTSAAYGINNSGDVVGGSGSGQGSGAAFHAFLYRGGTMTDLGALSGDTNSSADSINDAGQIVGSSDDGNKKRAFVYEHGQMYDLNSLIDSTDPLAGLVSLQEAVSISSNGLIAVNGIDSRDTGGNAGAQRAFLLVPSH